MSAKARFLKKLQDQQPRSGLFDTKCQADIAEFCQQMGQLNENIESWLTDTGIGVEETIVSVLDSFASGSSFNVPGIVLNYEHRRVKFTPVFLYGQGVTGGVEVTFCADGQITSLYRLFMRSSDNSCWSYSAYGSTASSRLAFSEDVFFDMIGSLLPD